MSAVAVDPTNPRVAFVGGTGGVFRTVDGGNRWVHFRHMPLAKGCPIIGGVQSIAVDPGDPNRVFLAQYGSPQAPWVGIYESSDGGEHWTFNAALGHVAANKVYVHPSATNTVYVGYQGGAARSTDGGKTWTKICPKQCQRRVRLAIDPTDPETVYVATARGSFVPTVYGSTEPERGFLFKSTDGGRTWHQLSPGPLMPAEYISSMVVDAVRPSTIFVGTTLDFGAPKEAMPRILVTADGGRTWRNVPDPTQYGAVATLAVDPGGHFLFMARSRGAGIARLQIGLNWLV
jgi:photosystem II stability/assembly factor-like uncharacterized protein